MQTWISYIPTPYEIVKKAGVRGSLFLFFKFMLLYFIADADGSFFAAVPMKLAPILCLIFTVGVHGEKGHSMRAYYVRNVTVGLMFSGLGDFLLALPTYLIPGMASFAFAHLFYIKAFTFQPPCLKVAPVYYTAAVYYLTYLTLPGIYSFIVPLYTVLLTTMAWRGAVRGRTAALGSFLFLLSDAVLGMSMFGHPIKHSHVFVMMTYYLGQFCIAYNALDPNAIHWDEV